MTLVNPELDFECWNEDHKGRSELEASILIQNEEKKIGHFEFVGFVEGNDGSAEIDIGDGRIAGMY